LDVGLITRKMANVLNDNHQEKIAIKEEMGKAWTYKELHTISNAYANKLLELGVQKGDRVGILLYNCLEYFGLYFAIAKIGGIAVRLNFRLSSAELEYTLNDSQTKILCFHSNLVTELEEIRHQVSIQQYICLKNEEDIIPEWSKPWSLLESGPAVEVPDINIKLSDPVMLMYTSGTTGRPKGAIWTHDMTLWFSAMQSLKWKFTGQEIGMTTGPLYHVGAMEDIGLPILLMGGTLVITRSQGFKIDRILSVIEQEK
jgi:fatty-acyl-CoA synthase